jgi:hypothetical protein
MKIKIEMKNKKIILKSEIEKNNQFNKRQRKKPKRIKIKLNNITYHNWD